MAGNATRGASNADDGEPFRPDAFIRGTRFLGRVLLVTAPLIVVASAVSSELRPSALGVAIVVGTLFLFALSTGTTSRSARARLAQRVAGDIGLRLILLLVLLGGSACLLSWLLFDVFGLTS